MNRFFFWTLIICSLLFKGEAYSLDLIVKAGHVFDPVTGQWKKNQQLYIKSGKISSITEVTKENNQKVIDLGGFYLVPGLIDAHTHLFLADPTFEQDFSKGLLQFVTSTSLKDRKLLGEKRARSLLMQGFTAVRDLGNDGRLNEHDVSSDLRIYSSGPGYVPKWGQFPPGTPDKIILQEYERLNANTFKQLDDFKQKTVKIYADEEPNETLTSPEVLRKWVKKAHENNLKVAVHGILPEAIQAAIDAKADSLEHGTALNESQMKQMAAQKMVWVPSMGSKVLTRPELKAIKPHHVSKELDLICSKILKARDMGVKMAFGSDNYFSLEKFKINFGESTMEALLFLSECHVSSSEILQMATLHAAELIGDKSLGDLKVGSYADFAVYKKDPLKDLSVLKNPYKVFKAGQEVLK